MANFKNKFLTDRIVDFISPKNENVRVLCDITIYIFMQCHTLKQLYRFASLIDNIYIMADPTPVEVDH